MSETVTMTLTDFLLARIAEDEAVAREHRRILTEQIERGTYLPGHEPEVNGERDLHVIDGNMDSPAIEIGSARVLAECEAKRRIVALYREASESAQDARAQDEGNAYDCATDYIESALYALALPYAAHPDYRDEWRP